MIQFIKMAENQINKQTQRVISDLKLEDTKRKDSNTAILILNFTFKICLIEKKKFDNNIYLWSHR